MRINIKNWIFNFFRALWKRSLYLIILILWILLIGGIIFLKVFIGPLVPDTNFEFFLIGLGISPAFITGIVKVLIGAVYILIWLYFWHRSIRMYFWRTIMKYNPPTNEKSDEQE